MLITNSTNWQVARLPDYPHIVRLEADNGSVEMTPDQARKIAHALIKVVNETNREKANG